MNGSAVQEMGTQRGYLTDTQAWTCDVTGEDHGIIKGTYGAACSVVAKVHDRDAEGL